MKLLKVKNGLLETENFFLVSPFNDFAGSANVSRDISSGKMELISNNKIERQFNYDEFLIEIEKENFNTMEMDDYSMIYFGDGDFSFGIKDDDVNSQNKYWKILRQDGYIQAYASADGVNYNNIGGMNFTPPLVKQGFMKYSKFPLVLNNYKLYANPYVTVQNFPENTICELYDSGNNLIKTRIFNAEMECKVYLDSNNIEGYFIFKDITGAILYTTDTITLGYGDVWIISPYNFEILYLGNVVTNVNPTALQDLDEIISIRNIDTKDYIGVTVGTETSGTDLIELSLDGITFGSTVTFDIVQGENKNIQVRITKDASNHSFGVRDFQLVINE